LVIILARFSDILSLNSSIFHLGDSLLPLLTRLAKVDVLNSRKVFLKKERSEFLCFCLANQGSNECLYLYNSIRQQQAAGPISTPQQATQAAHTSSSHWRNAICERFVSEYIAQSFSAWRLMTPNLTSFYNDRTAKKSSTLDVKSND
jgi:hypothetical protein